MEIVTAGKSSEHIELLQLDKRGIKVAEYLTPLPDRELLKQKLHQAVIMAREQMRKKMRSDRAEYGKQIVQSLTAQLVPRYGRGYSKRNLWYMIQLFENYPNLQSMLGKFKNLSWTHLISLLPIKDELKRNFYTVLCLQEHWNTRTLKERINN